MTSLFIQIRGTPYWSEGVYYALSSNTAKLLEDAIDKGHSMCMDVVEHVLENPALMEKFLIPDFIRPYLRSSWEQKSPSLLGRFDLVFDGHSSVKIFEYNADTPTVLPESAVIQRRWQRDVFPDAAQFNRLPELLESCWRGFDLGTSAQQRRRVTLTALGSSVEDMCNCRYMARVAQGAGLDTCVLPIEQLGWDSDRGLFLFLLFLSLSLSLCRLFVVNDTFFVP